MLVILGPCAIESEEQIMAHAGEIAMIRDELEPLGFEIIFKASYKKPNRSGHEDFHGIGIREGKRLYQLIKSTYGLKITSDVHNVEEVAIMGQVLDIIQIPHNLSKDTELIQAAAKTGLRVSLKKGTFMKPEQALQACAKIRDVNNREDIIIIERGNSFGYGDIVVDMRNFAKFNKLGVVPTIDATHAALNRDFAPTLMNAGVAAGAQAVFLETHLAPNKALCDGFCMLKLERDYIINLLLNCKKIKEIVDNESSILL